MYALNLSKDNRILSVTYSEFATECQPHVSSLPNGDITEYLFINGDFVYDPLVKESNSSMQISQEKRIFALESAILEIIGGNNNV